MGYIEKSIAPSPARQEYAGALAVE